MTRGNGLFGRWVLVGALTLSGLLVLAHEVTTRRAYDESIEGITVVSENTIPSVQHLAEVRRAVRALHSELFLEVRGPAEAADRLEARWRVVDAHMAAYEQLPVLPAERPLRTELQGALARLRRVETAWVRVGAPGRDAEQREVLLAADEALDVLDLLVGDNARAAARAADAIVVTHARASGLSIALLLGILGAFTATAVIAFHVLRRSELEVARRLEELDAFTGRVAHDLKSPLQPALLGLTILRSEPLSSGQMATVERVERSLRRAAELVDRLLAFARAGARPAPDARAHIDGVLRDLDPSLRQLAAEERATLVLEAPPGLEVAAEPVAVASIIDNLARNALLYLGDAERREVRVEARPREGHVELVVSDTGPGMSPYEQRRLFRPFERGSGRGGSGLGLAIVSRLVDAYGGQVEVSSYLGAGTTFRVRLPRPGTQRRRG